MNSTISAVVVLLSLVTSVGTSVEGPSNMEDPVTPTFQCYFEPKINK